MTPLRTLQKLFEVRDVTHYLHLNTDSYAEHKALNEFYDKWLELADQFIETYQGKYGRITGVISITASTEIKIREYLLSLMVYLNEDMAVIIDKTLDSDLDNIIAEMKGLVNKTLYLLSLK